MKWEKAGKFWLFFCAWRGELLPNPAVLASGYQPLSQARRTQTHTYTRCVAQIKAWQPPLTPTTDWYTCPRHHTALLSLFFTPRFSSNLDFGFFPQTLHPVSPNRSFIISLSSRIWALHGSVYLHEICPAEYSFFSSPARESFFSWRGEGWMDGGIRVDGKKVDGKRDMRSERNRGGGKSKDGHRRENFGGFQSAMSMWEFDTSWMNLHLVMYMQVWRDVEMYWDIK